MTNIDAMNILMEWLSCMHEFLQKHSIKATVVNIDPMYSGVAAATLDTAICVASIRIWNSGMLEFILFDVKQKKELIICDTEHFSGEDVKQRLYDCADIFLTEMQRLTPK